MPEFASNLRTPAFRYQTRNSVQVYSNAAREPYTGPKRKAKIIPLLKEGEVRCPACFTTRNARVPCDTCAIR